MNTAGLILAAGESRRMGAPKALLPYRDGNFLGTLVDLFAARCTPVVVVLGAGAEEIQRFVSGHGFSRADRRAVEWALAPAGGSIPRQGLKPTAYSDSAARLKPCPDTNLNQPDLPAVRGGPPHVVINTEYTRGQLSSLQCGLRAVPSEADSVLFTLVDHPAVSESTVEALLEAANLRTLLCVPRYQGRRGHPIWFSRALIPEFLAEPVDGAARDVVRRHEAETEFLDLEDPGIVADIDDPAAYRSLVGGER